MRRLELLGIRLSIFVLMAVFFAGGAVAQEVELIPVFPPSVLSAPSASAEGQPQGLQDAVQPPLEQPDTRPPVQQPALASEAEEVSEIEQFLSGKAPMSVSTNIRQFGYNLFLNPPSTFAPGNRVPVSPDYVIGPGDEIKINVWGNIEGRWEATVDRDGNINVPKLGTLGVTGLTFMELKELLHKEFSKYFTGFEMNVSMGSLRTIRVYVVGNARRPGAYTVSSLSTLVNALFETGGPAKTGSMRNIQLKRGGKVVVNLDLYDFFINGDKSKDLRLMPEDVIFISPIGPVAGIAGNVKRPGIYELSGDTRISDLISMAGGIAATGYLQRIQAERIHKNEVKIIVDTNAKELSGASDIALKDGDLLKIFPITNVIVNAVALNGNVARPGQYQWEEGMRISTIIKDMEKDLLPETYLEFAFIERHVPPDYHKEGVSLHLGKALIDKNPDEDKLLQPYDTVHIYSKWDFHDRPKVRIAGAVNKAGGFDLRPNMKLSDMVKLAGGPKRFAFLEKAELTRVYVTNEGPKTERLYLNLEKALEGDPENDIDLKEDDYLFVRTVPEWQLYRTATIAGEVKFPGTYTVKKGERLSSFIERAGGYTDNAYLRGAVFRRESVRGMQQKSLDEMLSRLRSELLAEGSVQTYPYLTQEEINARTMEIQQRRHFIESLKSLEASGRMVIVLAHPRLLKGGIYDIELEDGDVLHIPTKNSVVNVIGAVMSRSTSLIYSERLDYKEYIQLAGGYADYASKNDVYVLKVDGSARKLARGFVNWSPVRERWEVSGLAEDKKTIEPGDTIVVPEKLERVAWLRGVKDITQILMQMAVTAGVVIKLF